jgi:hypothetical protein
VQPERRKTQNPEAANRMAGIRNAVGKNGKGKREVLMVEIERGRIFCDGEQNSSRGDSLV